MKSNIIQAFFRKTGKKTEINSTVIEIIDYKCAKCTKIIIKQFQICKIIVKNVFIIYSIKCVLKSKVDFGIGTDIVLYILILFAYRIRKLYVPIRREKK